MAVNDLDPTHESNRAVRTAEERRHQLWAVIVSLMVVVEMFFAGFPEGPDAAPWGEARRPLFVVAVGVLALVVVAVIQTKWGSREDWKRPISRPRGTGGYPAWFAFAAFGVGIGGAALYLYAVFWSVREGGSLHVLERRAAVLLLISSGFFSYLIAWLSSRRRGDG